MVVRVTNKGTTLAFQVHLALRQGGVEVLPVWWDDNYFELLPGESREVHVSYPRRGGEGAPVIEAEAWNAPAVRR
ncbi:MAG: hypothetical protein DMF78_03850 [Acidobacteria bacterium]|nr:MAG: hypothetical protein DMF78_03850 [Acidobacteriota bacterium]